ncbi:GNAT family N-acetyltransferase [Bacillus sp. T33-2]|uniref:GNAT family N-acetyltransferase n=1 Tax=Bacillus sp. T33-2 TaxID=2054168 RepID=UPI000C773DD4|nr:GNAT family N-acetyltransferase [Bacillus sp. T33-2]PLR95106.1 GNAT family N-acetyltransferase [Bacillus sp. T33-2]
MPKVEVRRPSIEDVEELHTFFRNVITDIFAKEGIGDKLDDIEEEIKEKHIYLERDFQSKGEDRYFLIALDSDKIIGSIEYGPASNLISHCTNNALAALVEVGTVFVHPDYQRQGVGNLLLNTIYRSLHKRGIGEFCLDSGYRSAQKIWKKKFGEPDYLLQDYWGLGYDHMIWRIRLSDLIS